MFELLKQQLQFEEGRRLKTYLCPAGHRTIGIGHNLDAAPEYHGSPIPDEITDIACDVIFTDDVSRIVEGLKSEWGGLEKLSNARRDAVVNMAFQMGVSGVMKFVSMRAYLDRGMWESAAKAALDSAWAKQTPARASRVAHQIQSGEYYKIPE